MENPNLLKAYRNFNSDGFEIRGVSLDKTKSQWKSAIMQDSIIWTTLGDLKGIYGEVPTRYRANYIPNNYLLNKEGIAIAKDLIGYQLQVELKRIFNPDHALEKLFHP